MKSNYRKVIFSLLLEGIAVVISFMFGYLHRCTLYVAVFYLVPNFRIVGLGLQFYFKQDVILFSRSLYILLFVINSIKWIVILWIYEKGYRKVAVASTIPLVLVMFISFWFSELGF